MADPDFAAQTELLTALVPGLTPEATVPVGDVGDVGEGGSGPVGGLGALVGDALVGEDEYPAPNWMLLMLNWLVKPEATQRLLTKLVPLPPVHSDLQPRPEQTPHDGPKQPSVYGAVVEEW